MPSCGSGEISVYVSVVLFVKKYSKSGVLSLELLSFICKLKQLQVTCAK